MVSVWVLAIVNKQYVKMGPGQCICKDNMIHDTSVFSFFFFFFFCFLFAFVVFFFYFGERNGINWDPTRIRTWLFWIWSDALTIWATGALVLKQKIRMWYTIDTDYVCNLYVKSTSDRSDTAVVTELWKHKLSSNASRVHMPLQSGEESCKWGLVGTHLGLVVRALAVNSRRTLGLISSNWWLLALLVCLILLHVLLARLDGPKQAENLSSARLA